MGVTSSAVGRVLDRWYHRLFPLGQTEAAAPGDSAIPAGGMARTKNIVLINSKIIVSNNPFSYTSTRSIYSAKERFKQTKRTIESVKKYIPDHYIVFIDNSLLPANMVNYFLKQVDLFINPTNDIALNNDTDATPTKALGELAQLLHAVQYLEKLEFEWTNLFKLCGRYVINFYFDYSKFNNSHNVFRINQPLSNYKSETCYFTSFYKISKKNYEQYKNILGISYNLFKMDSRYFNEPIELVLCSNIIDKITLDTIGVTIDCAVEKWSENV